MYATKVFFLIHVPELLLKLANSLIATEVIKATGNSCSYFLFSCNWKTFIQAYILTLLHFSKLHKLLFSCLSFKWSLNLSTILIFKVNDSLKLLGKKDLLISGCYTNFLFFFQLKTGRYLLLHNHKSFKVTIYCFLFSSTDPLYCTHSTDPMTAFSHSGIQ